MKKYLRTLTPIRIVALTVFTVLYGFIFFIYLQMLDASSLFVLLTIPFVILLDCTVGIGRESPLL